MRNTLNILAILTLFITGCTQKASEPVIIDETHGGTSTVVGWDSHNSVTLGIDKEGNMLYHYRDGGSGNGNEIYNIYDCETKKC